MRKGSQHTFNDIHMKVLDVRSKPAVKDAVVEVSKNGKMRGQAEIKIYKPSIKKKKGASIELRKASGYEYDHLLFLRDIVSNIIDCAIDDDSSESKSEVKLHKCNNCNWKSKSSAALKAHRSRLHANKQTGTFKCDTCTFKTKSKQCLNNHTKRSHQGSKRKPSSSLNSSTSSPPRKKIEKMNISLDTLDTRVISPDNHECKDMKQEVLDLCKQLEDRIIFLENQNRDLHLIVSRLTDTPKGPSLIAEAELEPPKHLKRVHKEHIPKLRGYVWRYIALGNGACANNCVAVALHEDENEAVKVKRKTLDHIADYLEDYYLDKIALPYIETVGTGKHSKTVRIDTVDDMKTFLKSEDALTVFSNSHELHAMSNIYNVTFNVFSYGKTSEERWNKVSPDPKMVSLLGSPEGLYPDISLYHDFDNHYDLLVKTDSRLATMGLVAGLDKHIVDKKDSTGVNDSSDLSEIKKDEKLLKESEDMDIEYINNIVEEQVEIMNTSITEDFPFKCAICGLEHKSHEILEAHLISHRFSCTKCNENFATQDELIHHKSLKHASQSSPSDWTCKDCEYKSTCVSELRKHLKETCHTPNITQTDRRNVLEDYKICYTCKMDFDNYHSLMQHRKEVHPSFKKCKKFESGTCIHGDKCWYSHSDTNQIETVANQFTCNLCANTFESRVSFMIHKKESHSQFVPDCEKFSVGKCHRSSQECWFIHKIKPIDSSVLTPSPSSVFPQNQPEKLPPDMIQIMNLIEKLHLKMNTILETKM